MTKSSVGAQENPFLDRIVVIVVDMEGITIDTLEVGKVIENVLSTLRANRLCPIAEKGECPA